MADKDKDILNEFGISEETYKKIVLEVEHGQVDYRLSDLTENGFIKKLFPKLSPEDQVKVLYFGRVQFWAGRSISRDP
jgi:hypothetical protein